MANPKMQTLPPSLKEKLQDESSQTVQSSPSTGAGPPKMGEVNLDQPVQSSPSRGAGPSKMSEVNRLLSSPDNSHVSMEFDTPCGSKKLDIPNQVGGKDHLYTSLKALVTKVVSQLRKSITDHVLDPDPISYRLPQNNEGINVSTIKTNPSSSVEVKTRTKTTLVGEETVSFLLPPDCLIGTPLEKTIQHESSFEERLQGWHIACRQRSNGKLDMSYSHGHSTRMFRSTVEVVEFIMEAMETPESDSLHEQGPATAMKSSSKRKRSSSKKEKIPQSKSLKISNAEKATVERFLEESRNNLQNICGSRWVAPGSEELEKYMNPSSEEEDNASSDEETQ